MTPAEQHEAANIAHRDMLFESASREDLIAMVILFDGENKKLKDDLACVTMAANINGDIVREQRVALREAEGKIATAMRELEKIGAPLPALFESKENT